MISNLTQALADLHPRLREAILSVSEVQEIPAHTEILREGQYVKVIPIVLDGLLKVFTRYEDKELLLYYIQPRQSCVMSFTAGLNDERSRVFAQTEAPTTALLLPAGQISGWLRDFPQLTTLFFQQYSLRYDDLLSTVHQVLFDAMDQRLYTYLKEKASLMGNPLVLSHRQIAHDLGTAREVVSRVMKKLVAEGKVQQHAHCIKILPW